MAVAIPTIVVLLGALFALAYLLSMLLGLPASLGFPPGVQVAGAVLVVAGLAVAVWVFRYRTPAAMVVSTYVTFTKLVKRAPITEPSGRIESLVMVMVGPQKYVRNPLYFGVMVITFGWALVGSATFVLVGAVLLVLWFRLILIPFEERELSALFGERYRRYADGVPMLIPFTKRRKRPGSVFSS